MTKLTRKNNSLFFDINEREHEGRLYELPFGDNSYCGMVVSASDNTIEIFIKCVGGDKRLLPDVVNQALERVKRVADSGKRP